MKKKTPYLDFYHNHIVSGKLPGPGLCNCLNWCDDLMLFKPDSAGKLDLWAFGNDYGGMTDTTDIVFSFSPLRQTIVLFLAAMNGEL